MRDAVRDEVMQRGSGVPAPEHIRALYDRAFAEHRTRALWSSRQIPAPTIAHALTITESLRVEGNLAARKLAEDIERACRAAV